MLLFKSSNPCSLRICVCNFSDLKRVRMFWVTMFIVQIVEAVYEPIKEGVYSEKVKDLIKWWAHWHILLSVALRQRSVITPSLHYVLMVCGFQCCVSLALTGAWLQSLTAVQTLLKSAPGSQMCWWSSWIIWVPAIRPLSAEQNETGSEHRSTSWKITKLDLDTLQHQTLRWPDMLIFKGTDF